MLDQLRELQTLDSRIDSERDRIATIEASVRDRSEYEAAHRRHAEAVHALRPLEASQKDLELKLGTARRQQAEVEQKLYGGRVGSPRELDDLQKRSADLGRQIATGDESLLALMEQIEAANRATSEAEAELKRIVAERRTYETSLLAERKGLAASIKQATDQRDQVRAQLEAATLRLYDRLRSTRGGLAVAEVRQRTCLGCRVSLTAAYEQRLKNTDVLVTCQSCGRFLYRGD